MTEIPNFAPGCFGSALAFKADDIVCGGCAFASRCEPMHLVSKKALQIANGIDPDNAMFKLKMAKREKQIALEKEKIVNPNAIALTTKARELIDRLDRSNLDIVNKLRVGENPFGSQMKFLKIAAHLLIRNVVPVSREFLIMAFMSKLQCQQNTADAYARLTVQALTHIGAVDNCDGVLTLRKGSNV